MRDFLSHTCYYYNIPPSSEIPFLLRFFVWAYTRFVRVSKALRLASFFFVWAYTRFIQVSKVLRLASFFFVWACTSAGTSVVVELVLFRLSLGDLATFFGRPFFVWALYSNRNIIGLQTYALSLSLRDLTTCFVLSLSSA